MSDVQIETDLKEILNKIDSRLERIENNITEIKIGQAKIEEKLQGFDKRLDSVDFINKGVLIGLIVAILGGFAKLFGIVGNP